MKMTRDEYREKSTAYFNKEFVERVNFPMLLREAAGVLFMREELDSEFSIETRRRLKQLNEIGYTDDDTPIRSKDGGGLNGKSL